MLDGANEGRKEDHSISMKRARSLTTIDLTHALKRARTAPPPPMPSRAEIAERGGTVAYAFTDRKVSSHLIAACGAADLMAALDASGFLLEMTSTTLVAMLREVLLRVCLLMRLTSVNQTWALAAPPWAMIYRKLAGVLLVVGDRIGLGALHEHPLLSSLAVRRAPLMEDGTALMAMANGYQKPLSAADYRRFLAGLCALTLARMKRPDAHPFDVADYVPYVDLEDQLYGKRLFDNQALAVGAHEAFTGSPLAGGIEDIFKMRDIVCRLSRSGVLFPGDTAEWPPRLTRNTQHPRSDHIKAALDSSSVHGRYVCIKCPEDVAITCAIVRLHVTSVVRHHYSYLSLVDSLRCLTAMNSGDAPPDDWPPEYYLMRVVTHSSSSSA